MKLRFWILMSGCTTSPSSSTTWSDEQIVSGVFPRLDADGDGFGNACDADINGDHWVRLDDVNAILAAMGPAPNSPADLNGDGFVGLDDAAQALGLLGQPPGPSALACPGAEPCF